MNDFVVTGYHEDTGEPLERTIAEFGKELEKAGAMPTAQEIANAIVAAKRNVTPFLWEGRGDKEHALPLDPEKYGRFPYGEITMVTDTGSGLCDFYLVDAQGQRVTAPDGVTGDPDKWRAGSRLNARHTANLRNVPLRMLRFKGSTSRSIYSIAGHIYLPPLKG